MPFADFMQFLSKFNGIFHKNSKNSKIHMKSQQNPISQNNSEKKTKLEASHLLILDYIQSYRNQNSVIRA